MFSSAKHGSHGFVRSLDSSYPSLTASAVGADRFWQIDLGCLQEQNSITNKGPSATGERPFLFSREPWEGFVTQDGAMRITIDIPDALYRDLMTKAAREKRSVKELILRSIGTSLRLPRAKKGPRVSFPLIHSKQPGSLEIDNAKIFEIIPFP